MRTVKDWLNLRTRLGPAALKARREARMDRLVARFGPETRRYLDLVDAHPEIEVVAAYWLAGIQCPLPRVKCHVSDPFLKDGWWCCLCDIQFDETVRYINYLDANRLLALVAIVRHGT